MHSEAKISLVKPVLERLGFRILGLLPILSSRKESQDRALEDVKRIALISPHLLKDMGFRYDPHSSNPMTSVWRKDDIVIWAQRTERHVVVQRKS